MKAFLILVNMGFVIALHAQDKPYPYDGNTSPLTLENVETFCGRDWMNSEQVMDSLKQVVVLFDKKLQRLGKDAKYDSTKSWVLLYSYHYVYRIEFDGVVSHQLCLEADTVGKRTQLVLKENGMLHEINSYGEKYVTLTDTFYYLGNCQMWTTMKYYYIRADKFEEDD